MMVMIGVYGLLGSNFMWEIVEVIDGNYYVVM